MTQQTVENLCYVVSFLYVALSFVPMTTPVKISLNVLFIVSCLSILFILKAF